MVKNSYKKLISLYNFLKKNNYACHTDVYKIIKVYASEEDLGGLSDSSNLRNKGLDEVFDIRMNYDPSDPLNSLLFPDGRPSDNEGKREEDNADMPTPEREINDATMSLSYGSKNKSRIRSFQKKLIKAGFSLDRYGADGIYGNETKRAVKRLIENAIRDGMYSGNSDGSYVDESLYSVLQSYVNRQSGAGQQQSLEETEDELNAITQGRTLYLGDSQMVGYLGNAIIASNGPGAKVAESGKTASWVASEPRTIRELKKKPAKIIISLNGNGISGTQALIDLILEYSPNSIVVWSGAPPPIYMKGRPTWAKFLKSKTGFDTAYTNRYKRNITVRDMLPAVWTFINPYDYIKYDEPLELNGKTYESGYTCTDCDGIHLPDSVSKDYVSSVSVLS